MKGLPHGDIAEKWKGEAWTALEVTDKFTGGCPDDGAVQATSVLSQANPTSCWMSRHGSAMSSLPALAQMDDLIQMTLPGPIRGRHCETVGGEPRCPWHSLQHYLAALCVSPAAGAVLHSCRICCTWASPHYGAGHVT